MCWKLTRVSSESIYIWLTNLGYMYLNNLYYTWSIWDQRVDTYDLIRCMDLVIQAVTFWGWWFVTPLNGYLVTSNVWGSKRSRLESPGIGSFSLEGSRSPLQQVVHHSLSLRKMHLFLCLKGNFEIRVAWSLKWLLNEYYKYIHI